MAYTLAKNTGESVAVPRLVFSRLPELEENWARVALYVIGTGETEPARIAAALRLKSEKEAQDALIFWKGAGLLSSAETPLPGSVEAAEPRAHMTTPEVVSASLADPAVAGLLQECQRLTGGVVTQADANIYASMYLVDHMPVDMILLGVSYYAENGRRTARFIERALQGWQREGINTGAEAERYLHTLQQRRENEREAAELFGLKDAKFTRSEKNAIADWYENFGYDRAMIAEGIAYAGEKKNVKYVNGILRAWYTKGYKTVRDVIADSALKAENVQTAEKAPAHNILGGGVRRAPRVPGAQEE